MNHYLVSPYIVIDFKEYQYRAVKEFKYSPGDNKVVCYMYIQVRKLHDIRNIS